MDLDKIQIGQAVYLDANFLVAYLLDTRDPRHPRAAKTFAQLLVKRCVLLLSTLTFDETWLAIKVELDRQKSFIRFRSIVNRFLQNFGLRILHKTQGYGFGQIHQDLHDATDRILGERSSRIYQFTDAAAGVRKALDNVRRFDLRPRDSFHLALMQEHRVRVIATNDRDFRRLERLGVVDVLNFATVS